MLGELIAAGLAALPETKIHRHDMDTPLVRWRRKHQMTQVQLSERCGLTQKSISAYETMARVPRGQSLARLMRETDLPLDALIFPEAFLQEHPDFLRDRPKLRPRKSPPKGPSSTETAIPPNRVYLIAKKDLLASPSSASI